MDRQRELIDLVNESLNRAEADWEGVASLLEAKEAVALANRQDFIPSTIPPNHKVPMVGAVVEVRYLYAVPDGSLYQPVYLGERSDVDATECVVSQLKFKATEEDDQ